MRKETLDRIAAGLFFLWIVLLLPWFLLAMVVGMAFDAGPTTGAYVLVSSVWTYPLSVGIVWKFREREPLIALLPFVNILACLILGITV